MSYKGSDHSLTKIILPSAALSVVQNKQEVCKLKLAALQLHSYYAIDFSVVVAKLTVRAHGAGLR
jgi:hypothetical protein